jgi:hypothetical protein
LTATGRNYYLAVAMQLRKAGHSGRENQSSER